MDKKNPAMQEKIEEWTDAELDECQLPATKVASLRSETSNCLDTANLLTAETISRGRLITKAIIVRKLSNGL